MKTVMLALGSSLVLLACHKTEAPVAAPRPAVVMTVKDGADGNLLAYSGEVRSRYEADLGFRIGGKLIERQVNLGDTVRKGQVLARLDAQDVRLSASSAVAQVAAAQADLALAKAEYERAQNLFAQKFLSGSAVDSRRTQFEAAQAKLRQAQAQNSVSDNQVGYATLLAGRDGVVTSLPVEVGQVVTAGQLIVRIADPAQREVLTWIPESRARQFKPGQQALVQVWGDMSKTYPGVLREIAASADTSTRTYAARVSVPAADETLSLGATAAVGFVQPSAASAVRVPQAAVVRGGDDKAQVWIVGGDNVVQARQVEVESYRDEVVVLRSGLNIGERIVTVGAHTLSAGQKVNPVEQTAPVVLDAKR
ncbi:efflux RND transporter periplasmic adaptor subunit [Uliginosibacterium sp. 31-16]|uniref:efflux RND transporter periplasmic adaptor subunit n=1 Tax=Uliginosibacterium sp. 31-16 TaxID=3068315 RepID=UPI00273EB09D|nr:efflux RND transporter periplasmic adaptor subunit [Uliginosibacterium sp. 31-16]MDP5238393.1 efflux RND transporter periplasmic adaptor subunit [Uliginosibacterium sp. 31-16]